MVLYIHRQVCDVIPSLSLPPTHTFSPYLKFMEVVGAMVLEVEQSANQIYWAYFWFSIFFIGVLATRMWLAWIGLGLVLLLRKGPRVAEKAWLPLMLSAWG